MTAKANQANHGDYPSLEATLFHLSFALLLQASALEGRLSCKEAPLLLWSAFGKASEFNNSYNIQYSHK
jgi:hypothetical protein